MKDKFKSFIKSTFLSKKGWAFLIVSILFIIDNIKLFKIIGNSNNINTNDMIIILSQHFSLFLLLIITLGFMSFEKVKLGFEFKKD